MWIILTIILAINSMWLLKLNKDLANRNEYLMKVDELKRAWQDEMDKDTDNKEEWHGKQKELLNKNPDDNKED